MAASPRLSIIKTDGERDTPAVTVAWHSIQKSSVNEASSEYISPAKCPLLESLMKQLQTSCVESWQRKRGLDKRLSMMNMIHGEKAFVN